MAMENIFAPVSIREDLEYRGKGRNIELHDKETKPVERPDDMFYIDGESARNVFMLGQAAIGKSVFCLRLVENWCKAHNPNSTQNSVAGSSNVWVKDLSKYVYLFFVQLRHVFKSRTSIIDMICKDVFQHHPECHDVIRQVISSEKYQCLLVIDGLDEWKISDKAKKNLKIAGLPNTENMASCTFLWSLRPWIMDRFSEIIRGNDRVVEIHGLRVDSISTVIEKVLVNVYELDKESLQYKDTFEKIMRKSQEAKLKSIMKIPLMAIACTQIWYEEKDVGNSMTSLYVALLDLLIRRSNKKSPLSSCTENKLFQDSSRLSRLSPILAQTKSIKEITSAILKLGKIAYEDIMADDTHLVFEIEELESSLEVYELNVALETGLLRKCEAPGSYNEENVSLNFFHKSIQEFLAAIYIESCGKMNEFHQHLTNVEVVLEHGNILLFLLGFNPNLASRISRRIVQITHSDAEICRYRTHTDFVLRRNSKVELLYKLQIRCIIEISYAKTLSSCYTRRTRHVSSRLNLFCTSAEEGGVPFDISDVFLENKVNEQTRIIVDIITKSNADIKSLLLGNVSTDTEKGIPDSLLIQFLDQTKSLQSLDISGALTDRTLFKISDRFSLLTALTLYNITIPPDAIRTLQTVLKSNKVIQTLGFVDIACKSDKIHGSMPASLSSLISMLPGFPRLSTLHIKIVNEDDKPVFLDVLSRLSHLQGVYYIYTYPCDNEYDRDVVNTICTLSELHWIHLYRVNIGDFGMKLSKNMLKMETVMLRQVDMSSAGWCNFIKSVTDIQHEFKVILGRIQNRMCVNEMIKSYPNLRIRYEETYNDGTFSIAFVTVRPNSQQDHE
ncbi:hypothetical protein FSP39_010157 [Pinctada imbricata]|uniref:NACHT domain-containing protein n=1 Tax=Pinctada imbricata TaxID=66713 RepID=A0AA88YG00_PINIB|nr:hypothetical protein FSP39_010157 [Pinctada imbricata]